MKKLILVLALVLMPLMARADDLSIGDTLKKIPGLKQGVMYNFQDHQIDYITTLQVASWKNISFEAGYAPESTALIVISYPILKLKDLGVTLPILDLIECNIGAGIGYKRIGSDNTSEAWKWGATVTLLNIKW